MNNYRAGILTAGEARARRIPAAVCDERATKPAVKRPSESVHVIVNGLLNPANPPQFVQTQRTRKKQRSVPADPKSLERQVPQALADKISGNQVGIWLLLPEHLRLGTWDLIGQPRRPRSPATANCPG
jgi:hypothetical protein